MAWDGSRACRSAQNNSKASVYCAVSRALTARQIDEPLAFSVRIILSRNRIVKLAGHPFQHGMAHLPVDAVETGTQFRGQPRHRNQGSKDARNWVFQAMQETSSLREEPRDSVARIEPKELEHNAGPIRCTRIETGRRGIRGRSRNAGTRRRLDRRSDRGRNGIPSGLKAP